MADSEPKTDFFTAVRDNNVARVSALLAQNLKLAGARCPGDNRLLGAVWNERSSHDPVPANDPRSCTALHHAAYNGLREIAEILLHHGADPNAIGYDNNRGNFSKAVVGGVM